jgi:transposase-like protein
MSSTERKHVSDGDAGPARRVEIFTGAGRRRRWSVQEKAAIVAESFGPGVRACHVARRHGLTPQQSICLASRDASRGGGGERPAAVCGCNCRDFGPGSVVLWPCLERADRRAAPCH